MSETGKKVLRWCLTGKTGISSMAIAAHLTGVDTTGQPGDHPHDPDDLGRCLALLEQVPEFEPRIGELAERSKEWAALVENWSVLSSLYFTEKYKRCYARMREILDSVPNKEGVQLRDGVSLYMGTRE